MASYVSDDESKRIECAMFKDFGRSDAEQFLRRQLKRYIPQFSKASDDEIRDFVDYQKSVYLDSVTPVIGRVIACLNPTFVDSLENVRVSEYRFDVYTRASLKENGYRMQLHRGVDSVCAMTRQFTHYDLRMFPELDQTIERLPVMIGDAELVSRRFPHLAGFDKVEERIPGTSFWPSRGQVRLDNDHLNEYLSNPLLFADRLPKKDLELTLSFHGLFAIAHPDTWGEPRAAQAKSLLSLCGLPVDYEKVDELLDRLSDHLIKHDLNARCVERKVISDPLELRSYVKSKEEADLEGSVVVQCASDSAGDRSFKFAQTFKLKKYETIDTALLGLYLDDRSAGLAPENVTGALLGLFDPSMGRYLPVCKVNLDPSGRQIKTYGQRERLARLRSDISSIVASRQESSDKIPALRDAYGHQGRVMLSHVMAASPFKDAVLALVDGMPRGYNLSTLLDKYRIERSDFQSGKGSKKSSGKTDQCVFGNKDLLEHLLNMESSDRRGYRRILDYFCKSQDIAATSKKLVRPEWVVTTSDPVIIETKVFSIKWGESPFPAGFHSWYCDSFVFENVFAERIRNDKNDTTDFEVIHDFCRKRTPRKKRIVHRS